jgi:hypothetical protein
MPVAKGLVGWSKADWPAIKGSANFVRNLDAWALHEKGWQPIDPKIDQFITELPKTPPSPAKAPAAPATPATPVTLPYGPPLLTDKDGRTYYEGREILIVQDARGRIAKWPLPPSAVGKSERVWLIRTDEGLLFLFNQPGRVVRIKPTPEGAEPYTVEAVFTNRIPNTDLTKVGRIWLDPSGRIVIAYEKNKLAILFPSGRVPKDLALMIVAKELQ